MTPEKKIIGVIPARYASLRFPGKPLANIQGKPMIQWVYETCRKALKYVYVATDDERIFNTVDAFGGKALMTSTGHRSGTDRCLEALEMIETKEKIRADILINIQGDEPMIKEEQLEELISCFENNDTEIATLIKQVEEDANPLNPNLVKVVVDKNFKALYFSRSLIPFPRNDIGATKTYRHIGLYAYTSETLRQICQLKASPLELTESLEQLRWLENGFSIQTRITEYAGIGVDTPEDLERLLAILS